jgi:hypothetical protein
MSIEFSLDGKIIFYGPWLVYSYVFHNRRVRLEASICLWLISAGGMMPEHMPSWPARGCVKLVQLMGESTPTLIGYDC